MNEQNTNTNIITNETNLNTVTILREDFSHIIKKSDVWLVYTTKTRRPWVTVPGRVSFCDDGTIIIVLATLAPNGGSYNA